MTIKNYLWVSSSAGGSAAHGRAASLRSYFILLRPHQWIKNAFVFAPLIFAGELTSSRSIVLAVWAFLSFSLVASAVYVLNDWFDQDQDRQHPVKRARPIASGLVSHLGAAIFGTALLAAGFCLALVATNTSVAGLEALYLAINLLYVWCLKNVVLLDVFAIATGFVIRILVGASAVRVGASHWVLLCTLLLALFLGFAKRRSELELLKGNSVEHREVLSSYSTALITQLNVILCAATVVCYAIYTVAPDTMAKFGTDRLIYTVPFVIYGLFRYLYLVEVRSDGGNPASLVVRDLPLTVCIALWLLVCCFVIYTSGHRGGTF
ncbi:MAG: decaprenyl-phosphate phosphoribosyltransferase [Acidobacteriales bacterium]|nr:decaprenyl-phosphate phosphoribosyltransferase [Terriglobales bacterium]